MSWATKRYKIEVWIAKGLTQSFFGLISTMKLSYLNYLGCYIDLQEMKPTHYGMKTIFMHDDNLSLFWALAIRSFQTLKVFLIDTRAMQRFLRRVKKFM